MRISKRLLSLMILVIFVVANIVTLPVSAEVFSDVTGSEKYANAVTFLNSLGVINGYEDGTFRPLENVNRAEFTAMLMRYRGLGAVGDLSVENPPYPDVTDSDVSWAIGNIRTAKSLGIVNGYEDGSFRPKNNVLYEEAVKMIVCALGYEHYSPEGTQWFSKYITSATKLGILKGADGGVGVPATRSCIAQLLFNCNNVEVAQNGGFNGGGGSIIDTQLNLKETTGVIYSNKITSLNSPDVNLRDNEILVYSSADDEPEVYTVNKNIEEYQDRLGYKVKLYYEYDRDADKNIISSVSYITDESDVVTINAADIIDNDTDSTSIAYYDEDDEKSVSVSNESIVVYNGKLYGSNASESTFAKYLDNEELPILGTVKLIENNGDRTFDVLLIDSYDVYVVSSVTSGTTYTVVDNLTRIAPNNTLKLTADDKYLEIKDKSGSKVSLSSIKKGSVLCVKESNNSGKVVTTVVVCNNSVSGEIKGVTSGKRVKIGSNTYNYSYAAPWMRDDSSVSMAEPKMGDNGTYYLDLNGDIVAYNKSETSTNQQYAYLINVFEENEGLMETSLYLSVLTQKDGLKMLKCDNKTKINGSQRDYDEIIAELQSAEEYQGQDVSGTTNNTGYSQLIKISTTTRNGSTVIDEIITAQAGKDISEVSADYLQMSTSFNAKDKTAVYDSTSKRLTVSGKTVNIRNSFIVKVPNDRSDEKLYKKGSTGDLSNGAKYNVEVYDLLNDGTAKVIVLYNLNSKFGEVYASTSTFVVTSKEHTSETKDGETRWVIKGYSGKSTNETTLECSLETEDAFEEVQVGDVIRLGKDSDGFYTLNINDILYGEDVDRDEVISIYASGEESLKGQDADSGRYRLANTSGDIYRAIWGYVYACGGENLAIHDKLYDVSEKDLAAEDYETRLDYDIPSMSGTLFIEYSMDGTELVIDVLNDNEGFDKAQTFKGLSQLVLDSEPTELFIFDVNDIPSLVIISRI